MKTISCDEAGYTGNRLLSADQPYFVYASVAINHPDAQRVLDDARRSYRLQMPEIKGNKLTKSTRGQRAALDIMRECQHHARVLTVEKPYALAGKFYEYMCEPILASHSMLFYNIHFHRFISNMLYMHLITRDEAGIRVLSTFEQALMAKEFTQIETVLESLRSYQKSPFIQLIAALCLGHKDRIINEWATLTDDAGVGTWILDITATALFALLNSWGIDGEPIDVYCDQSKPLLHQHDLFDRFINWTNRDSVSFAGNTHPLGYHLVRPLQIVDSQTHPGIQLADVFASSLAYAFKNEGEDFSQQCINICKPIIHKNSIYPDPVYVDPTSEVGFTNLLLLKLLVQRTRRRQNLFHQLPVHLQRFRHAYLSQAQNDT